jgi:hypothetical protein
MPRKMKSKRKRNLPKLDQASSVHLIMLLLTMIVYIVFLSVQQFLFSFEGLRNKIIIINVLLAVGMVIEIGYFVWEIRKRQTKSQEHSEKKKISKDKEEVEEDKTNG